MPFSHTNPSCSRGIKIIPTTSSPLITSVISYLACFQLVMTFLLTSSFLEFMICVHLLKLIVKPDALVKYLKHAQDSNCVSFCLFLLCPLV
jgi:hypothetical protein